MKADWTGGPEQLQEADKQRRDAAQLFQETQVPLITLWTYYYGIGGDVDEVCMDAYLNEALHLPPAQVALIATAMREIARDGIR